MDLWVIIGFMLFIWVFIRFIKKLGNDVPVLELMSLIALAQWFIGPLNSYSSSAQHDRYHMYVPESTYFSYIIPALFVFIFFLMRTIKINVKPEQWVIIEEKAFYGKKLAIIGILASLTINYFPNSLRFAIFLLQNLMYVGAGILLFSKVKTDKFWFYGVLTYLFLHSFRSGLFHDLLLWGIFLFMIWCLKYQPSMKTKVLIIGAGITFAVMLQVIKSEFRSYIWQGYEGNNLELAFDILQDKLSGGYLEEEENTETLNARLNQGWIISAIMHHTPEYEPFAEGETISVAISSSLLPRFISEDKKRAGGQENFMRFTGLNLTSTTSMGMSIIGEAYANFGSFGGFIFMGFWGYVLMLYWNKLVYFVTQRPFLLFFIPILFLQVVKAETELAVVLNHLFKSSFLIFI